MNPKTFVIDTNVLLHDPESLAKFPNSNIVLPMDVIEELNRMKRFPHELGRNSRLVFQFLDSLSKEGKGDFNTGLKLQNGAVIKIYLRRDAKIHNETFMKLEDNHIIMTALMLKHEGEKVIFVSKDFVARIKAEALGIEAEDYENLKYSYDSLYRGHRAINVTKREIDQFFKNGNLPISKGVWYPNEYCVITAPENSTAIGKYDSKHRKITSLPQLPELWGIKPLNTEQRMACDLLLRDDIKLVTLVGPAGTGKTLLTLACALRKVFDEGNYNRILVSRPVIPLGRDIGYLPGTKEDKLFHWMQPIYDNLEFLCESTDKKSTKDTMQWVMDSNRLELEAVTYIRGRSLPKAYIIVDEAQNLTPHEMKTIISRAGEDAKVVLTGDPTQIDNPYLDKDSNGLTYTVGKFCDQSIYGHLFLEKTERSKLAAIAADIL